MSNHHQLAFLKSMPPLGTKRRVLEEMTLEEISAVDKPAVKGATVAIVKREDHDEPLSFATFEEACAEIQKRGLDELGAMQAVARQHPELLRKYNEPEANNLEKGRGLLAQSKRDAALKLDQIADGISARENVPAHIALRLARQRNPEVYRLAYEPDKT